MTTTAIKSAVTMPSNAQVEPIKLLKRVGSTTVEVTVHFNSNSTEAMADIVSRLIEREVDKIA